MKSLNLKVLTRMVYSKECSMLTRMSRSSGVGGQILSFWFQELTPRDWFSGEEEVDQRIKEKFHGDFVVEVADGKYDHLRSEPLGLVALVIAVDQFPRNIFRGTPKAFEFDPVARKFTKEFVDQGFIEKTLSLDSKDSLEVDPKMFVRFALMPLMHHEDLKSLDMLIELTKKYSLGEDYLKYSEMHKSVIQRFGRYPLRNRVLGRESTIEEQNYIKENGSSQF